MDVAEIVDAVDRVASGRSVVDPDVVRELFDTQRRRDPLAELTPRERDVLALMAEGRSNAGIARRLWLAGGTVEKHVKSILTKLGIQATDDDHRRAVAVTAFPEKRCLPASRGRNTPASATQDGRQPCRQSGARPRALRQLMRPATETHLRPARSLPAILEHAKTCSTVGG